MQKLETTQGDHYLLRNEKGEYHISVEEFNKLGEKKAFEFAEKEINKKLSAEYSDKTINFEQARSLGFCSYGIKDFAEKLKVDVNESHSIQELNEKLTIEALKKYPEECIKLFGENTLKYLGGIKGVLKEDTINLVLRKEFIKEEILHKLSIKFAHMCLENFEKDFPEDKRPRLALEAKEAWLKGEITARELEAAEAAARSAAWSAEAASRSAARSAAWSAEAAARSAEAAAWSAARSAAWSAARSAAWSAEAAARSAEAAARSAEAAARSAEAAAWSASKKQQIKMILEEING